MLAGQCKSIEDVRDLLKRIFKGTLLGMLEAEMTEHLGYEKNSQDGDGSGNSLYGYNVKTIQSDLGEAVLRVPRDRNREFEPKVIGKYQTKTDNLEQQIIAMYAKGMSNRDIEDHLRDIYSVEASAMLVSRFTSASNGMAIQAAGCGLFHCVFGWDRIQGAQGQSCDQQVRVLGAGDQHGGA